MVAIPRAVGVAEFLAIPDDGNRHEYVRGEVRSMPPPESRHGVIEGRVFEEIARYTENDLLPGFSLPLAWLF
jgi:Uma2 family endonuclease